MKLRMWFFAALMLNTTAFFQKEVTPHFPEQKSIEGMSEWDHRNLERNLRWILERDRQRNSRQVASDKLVEQVGVFVDVGVWHIGARSIVECLESQKIGCRVLDRSQITEAELRPLKTLILPGGWAPFQWQTLGEDRLRQISKFVEGGGRVVAVCAGAYLVSKEVRYLGQSFPYPMGMFDGIAEGPVEGLAKFPQAGPVKVKATSAGKAWSLDDIEKETFLYGGGPRFVGGSAVQSLLQYADGTAAAVFRRVGKGSVVAIGIHLERRGDANEAISPNPAAGRYLKTLALFDAASQK